MFYCDCLARVQTRIVGLFGRARSHTVQRTNLALSSTDVNSHVERYVRSSHMPSIFTPHLPWSQDHGMPASIAQTETKTFSVCFL